MGFAEYIQFIIFALTHIPFNIFDYIVFLAFVFYVLEDAMLGVLTSFISFTSTVSSFFISLIFYKLVSQLLVEYLHFTKGLSDAASFLILSGVVFLLISLAMTSFKKIFINFKIPKKANLFGGAFFGAFSFFFIASFIVALLLSFPIATVIKDNVRNSVTGKFLFSKTQLMELSVKQVFGGAIEDTINFLTVKPKSDELVRLNFSTSKYVIDYASEKEMLRLINIQRRKNYVSELSLDGSLSEVSRMHAKDMLQKGYFSHYTPEGLSPFDRLEMSRIFYVYAGENLALAPDVQIAMDGLMKSPGHRENILSKNFKKIGIGVLDGGVYGKMFVQEFTD